MTTLTTPTAYVPADADEARFLAEYDAGRYPRPSVTVDIVLLTVRAGQLCVLLVERADYPYRGRWALPGGFLEPGETADDGARRELLEETATTGHLEQLRHYTDPQRDPRTRVVSLAYLALLPDMPDPVAGSDARAARFTPVAELRASGVPLAFDHDQILRDGIERAASKLEYTTVATAFCPPEFTLTELRRVYETVWDEPLDRGNFTRKVLRTPGFVTVVDGTTRPGSDTGGRPSKVYRAGPATALMPPLMRASLREQLKAARA